MLQIICYGCQTKHKVIKFHGEVKKNLPLSKHDLKVVEKVVGYLCDKCSKKHLVVNRPKGLSWKAAFKQLQNMNKKQK